MGVGELERDLEQVQSSLPTKQLDKRIMFNN